MVAQGAGAAGPVLLACRQWDPLGLAQRLPSLGVGAWRCAPLLPWRVQCPVCVCAAIAAGSGGSGRYLVLCLYCFPLPAPRVPRLLWRAVPSGCPLPSLAGTPFHAVCVFRVLGPVALLVVPACPLHVCALALPRRPLPPVLGGVGCAPRAIPALGAGRAVPRGPCPSACPAPVPPSVWLAWGGAVWSRFSPTWLGVVGVAEGRPRGAAFHCCEGRPGSGAPPPTTARPLGGLLGSAIHVLLARACGCEGPSLSPWSARPVGAARRGAGPRRSCAGRRAGGGGGVRRPPRLCGRGGPVGRGVALPHSVPLPSLGRQQSGRHWRRSVHGGRGPPYHSGSCSPAFTGRDLCGILARWGGLACSPRFQWEPAAGAGGRVALQLLSPAGEGGTIPPASGGGGRGPRGLRAGGGGRGGGRAAASLLPLWVAARGTPSWPPSCSRRRRRRRALAVRGRGAAPGWVGMRGSPWTAPPGAPADLNPPSALPG